MKFTVFGRNKSASKPRLGKVLLLVPCLFFLVQVCKYFCILPSIAIMVCPNSKINPMSLKLSFPSFRIFFSEKIISDSEHQLH